MRVCRLRAMQSQKAMKEIVWRAKRLTREMQSYWKRYDRVEKVNALNLAFINDKFHVLDSGIEFTECVTIFHVCHVKMYRSNVGKQKRRQRNSANLMSN